MCLCVPITACYCPFLQNELWHCGLWRLLSDCALFGLHEAVRPELWYLFNTGKIDDMQHLFLLSEAIRQNKTKFEYSRKYSGLFAVSIFGNKKCTLLWQILRVLGESAIAVRTKAMKCLSEVVAVDPSILARVCQDLCSWRLWIYRASTVQ